MINDIKVLVVSVSSWNSKVGMNTWPELLKNFNPDNVANICLREETPDSPACNNYFVISENRVLKSVLKRGIKTGYRATRETADEHGADLVAHKTRYNKMKKKRSPFLLFARECAWKLGKWKTKELKSFITEFSPDVILFSMDGYIHLNRICRYAIKMTCAASIGFFCDDNFTYKQPYRFGDKVLRFFQRKSLKKLAKKTDAFWAITEKTKKEADEFFGIDSKIITKPVREGEYSEWEIGSPLKLLYTGNLGIGRDRSLVRLCDVIAKEFNGLMTVDAYTNTHLDDEIVEKLNMSGVCTLHPPVAQSTVLELQKKSDILLFLEDVDGPNAKTARLSFSTKITDYFGSGRCILAFANKDIAPMSYFEKHSAAITASSEEELKTRINEITEAPKMIHEYALRAFECGQKNHRYEDILSSVEDSIRGVLGNK